MSRPEPDQAGAKVLLSRRLPLIALFVAAVATLIVAAAIESWALLGVALVLCIATRVCREWARRGGPR